MRAIVVCVAGLVMLSACSKKPDAAPASAPGSTAAAGPAAAAPASAPASAVAAPAPTGAPISGVYSVNGKAATLTQVTAHPDEPFDGKPVTAILFTSKDQGGDPKAFSGALFGHFGDAVLIKVNSEGQVVECEVVNSGLTHGQTASLSGVFKITDFQNTGGQISGHLTSGGPTDFFGDKIDVDLTFHTTVS
jgi:hypothetical protein